MPPQCFWWHGASLQCQPTSLKRLFVVFIIHDVNSTFLQAEGSLSIRLPMHAIAIANKAVKNAIVDKGTPWQEMRPLLHIHGSFGWSKIFHTLSCCLKSWAPRTTLPHACVRNFWVKIFSLLTRSYEFLIFWLMVYSPGRHGQIIPPN